MGFSLTRDTVQLRWFSWKYQSDVTPIRMVGGLGSCNFSEISTSFTGTGLLGPFAHGCSAIPTVTQSGLTSLNSIYIFKATYLPWSQHQTYPPTPALAKAGAAPGTTAGVELVFLSHINGFWWASKRAICHALNAEKASNLYNLSFLATGIPRPHQWPLIGPKPAVAWPSTLQKLQTVTTLQKLRRTPNRAGKSSQATSMRNAQPCRQKLPQGQIHRFFWAVQPAVRQAFAANRHPKATYRRPSLPFASP